MSKSLNIKVLMAFMLGISFLSLQASSIAVESEAHTDNVVVITVDSTNLQFSVILTNSFVNHMSY